MSEKKEIGVIRPFMKYILEALRFHEIGAVLTTRILFVVMLMSTFLMYFLLMEPFAAMMVQAQQLNDSLLQLSQVTGQSLDMAQYEMMTQNMVSFFSLMLVGKTFVFILLAFYGYLYFCRMTKPDEMPTKAVIVRFLKKLPVMLITNAFFYVILGISLFAISIAVILLCLVIPLFIPLAKILLPLLFVLATASFAFLNMSVLDQNAGIISAFSVTLKTTSGNMRVLVRNLLLLFGLGIMITLFAAGMSSGLVALFLSSLGEVIIGMITMKMTILMYGDARKTPLPMKTIQIPKE